MIMKHIFVAAFLVAATACAAADSDGTKSEPPTNADRAASAAATANAIALHPAVADSVLRAAGFTRDAFETLLYEIAADSAMSVEYTRAKGP